MRYLSGLIRSRFHRKVRGVALACGIVLSLPVLQANHHEHRSDTESRLSGNSLEYQLWNLVQVHDRHGLAELISPLFLGRNQGETQDYDAKLAALSHLSIASFSILNIIESQDDDVRMVSYDFVATGPHPINDHRISVWQRKKHKHHQYFWQLISQSSVANNP